MQQSTKASLDSVWRILLSLHRQQQHVFPVNQQRGSAIHSSLRSAALGFLFFAWISVFMRLMWHDIEIFFNFFFCLLIFHRYIIKKKKNIKQRFSGLVLSYTFAHVYSLSHCCVLTVSCRFESRYCWVQCWLSHLFSLSPYVFLSVSREDLKYERVPTLEVINS